MTIPVNDGLDKNVHVESCVLLERVSNRKPDAKIRIAYNIGLLILCMENMPLCFRIVSSDALN